MWEYVKPSIAGAIEQRADLTRKQSLTYNGRMVVTPNHEPDVFAAISHPARRRMLDLLTETQRSAPREQFANLTPTGFGDGVEDVGSRRCTRHASLIFP